MPQNEKSIFICAGDPSGDIAGSHLISQISLKKPQLKFFGLGGRLMKKAGQNQLIDGDRLAVLGFWEVAKKYFFFRRLMNDTIEAIRRKKPAAIILIDYPGFNLRLAKRIKRLGIPVIYYISPQIWAWGAGRIDEIKKYVDSMLLILPFEKDIYNQAGVKNIFIGHYLLDDIDTEFIKAPFNPESKLITLLPGSRPQEVERMLPVLVKSTPLIAKTGDYKFAVGAVAGDIDYKAYIGNSPVPIDIVGGRTRELIAESRLVITSSGTATLETGIIGRPMIVIYKTGWITYHIARRLVRLDKIALINIAAGEKIVPELIQKDASPENIAGAAEKFLTSDEYSQSTVRKLNLVTDTLGTPGAAERAADAIMEIINC